MMPFTENTGQKERIVVKSIRPNFWEVKPTFDWGMNEICPYIWLGWWLITFEPFDISYMPD